MHVAFPLAPRRPAAAALLLGLLLRGARGLAVHTGGNATRSQMPEGLRAWLPAIENTAVVRPFWLGELLPLVQAEHEALGCERHACSAGADYRLPIDLVLYYAGSPADPVVGGTAQLALNNLAQTLSGRGCFRAVRVAYAGLSPDVSWPQGPCQQFMGMVLTSPKPFWGYRAIYQMELDVLPVRDGWLLGLLPMLAQAARNEAWVIGGHYTPECMVNRDTGEFLHQPLSWNMGSHINGNAVYSGDPLFGEWARRQSANCVANGHYDSWMYELAVKQNKGHLWRSVPEILNCKPNVVARSTYRTMDAHALAARFPSALMAHSTVEPTGICP